MTKEAIERLYALALQSGKPFELNDLPNMLNHAHQVWPFTYGLGKSDREVFEYLGTTIPEFNDPESKSQVALFSILFALKWIDGGSQQLTTSHKFAAAAMCTPTYKDWAEDLEIPWKAFRVLVPDGILTFEDYKYTKIDVAIFDEIQGRRGFLAVTGENSKGPVRMVFISKDLTSTLFSEADFSEELNEVANGEKKSRVATLAKRLVVAALCSLQNALRFSPAGKVRPKVKKGDPRTGPPKHRATVFGRPIQVDCRPAIRSFLGQGGGVPTVQTLVRGHYKRQVIGIAKSGRKVIWIEPYWRGPEDALILARPYKVGEK
jgi:hypothetical protein